MLLRKKEGQPGRAGQDKTSRRKLLSTPNVTKQTNIVNSDTLQNTCLQTVNFYNVMGVEASRHRKKLGGAWRAWVLAKALDAVGYGRIPREALREYAKQIGVKDATFRRWLRQAEKLGLLHLFERDGAKWYHLPSAGKVAAIMGCESVGYKVEMAAADFVGIGWKARVWATYEAIGPHGRQVSREVMQKTVNVPARTQARRSKQAGVYRQKTYAKLGVKLDPHNIKIFESETKQKGVFIAAPKGQAGAAYARKPDIRSTKKAALIGKGRSRKADAEIARATALKNSLNKSLSFYFKRVQNDLSERTSRKPRILCQNPKQAKASIRKARYRDDVREIFEKSHVNARGNIVYFTHEII